MLRSYPRALVLITMVLLVLSCGKNGDDNDGAVLVRMESADQYGQSWIYFEYDDKGKLVKMQQTQRRKSAMRDVLTTWLINYDAAGTLATIRYTTEGEFDQLREYTFHSTKDTLRVVITSNQSNTVIVNKRTVLLDQQQRVLADTARNTTNNIYSYSAYTYTAAGDVSKATYVALNNGTPTNTYTDEGYQYDNRNNPHHKLGLVYYLATDENRGFSVHNTLGQQLPGGSTTTTSYAYNKSNMPVSAKTSVKSGSLSNELTRIFYYRP